MIQLGAVRPAVALDWLPASNALLVDRPRSQCAALASNLILFIYFF